MPLLRASTQCSAVSHVSQPISGSDVPGRYPDTEAARAVSTQQTLSDAIHARRAEFTRPNTIRIKVGSWNVAGKKGTESDIAAWFIKSKGVSETLTGLRNTHISNQHNDSHGKLPTQDRRESIDTQEARVAHQPKRTSTVPKQDHGELPGRDQIGLYVLGLQEIVDIASATEALRPYSDPAVPRRWKDRLEEALPHGYQLIAQQQLTGLMLFIYASPSVASQISSVSTTHSGTGIMGYMGNKGAVTTRLVLGETTRLAFINSHLSSGLGKAELDRRNWDAAQIVSRTQYDPIQDSLGYISPRRERIGDEDFAFWFGDLNYRLEGIPGEDVRRLLMLHTRNEYDLAQQKAELLDKELEASAASIILSDPSRHNNSTPSKPGDETERTSSRDLRETDTDDEDTLDPSSHPAHLQTTLDSLLPHDELRQMRTQRRAFHDGWREGPITFLPTYKYDVGSVGLFDSGDKKRGPSWCDRILYRTRKDKIDYDNMILEEQDAQRKDKQFDANGMEQAASEGGTLYEYDPDTDAEEVGHNEEFATGDHDVEVTTREGFKDLIQLEYYVSHQRVLSSDHKPLDAVFRLEYDAVIPELKSQVHQEVARDLDRAENEARPAVTLIPDSQANGDGKGGNAVDFGDVRYEEVKEQTMTLANIGRVDAFFGFLSRQQETSDMKASAPEWLNVSVDPPSSLEERGATKHEKRKDEGDWAADIGEAYRIEPGSTCTVRCTANVKMKALAKQLNDGATLDDVLVLRVKDGRDHFVLVHGTWMQTVFTRSIGELIRFPDGGPRMLQKRRLTDSEQGDVQLSKVTSSAPKELFRLTRAIEALSERIIAEWSMLQSGADSKETAPWLSHAAWPFDGWTLEPSKRQSLRNHVIEALDSGQDFDQATPADESPLHRLEALCEALLLFLDNLADGVINEELWERLVRGYFGNARAKLAVSRDDQRAVILEILATSSPHSVSFVLVTSMLGTLSQEVTNNARDSKAGQIPTSPKLHIRRKTLSIHPEIARKQLVQKNYAAIFADVLVRLPENTSPKARLASQDQRRELIEVFLDHEPG